MQRTIEGPPRQLGVIIRWNWLKFFLLYLPVSILAFNQYELFGFVEILQGRTRGKQMGVCQTYVINLKVIVRIGA